MCDCVTDTNNWLNNNKSACIVIHCSLDSNLWRVGILKTFGCQTLYVAFLRRIRAYLPHQTRITFYKAYILPHIDYCNSVGPIYTCAQNPHSSKNGPQNNHICPIAYLLSHSFCPMWCDAHTNKSQVLNSDHGLQNTQRLKSPIYVWHV